MCIRDSAYTALHNTVDLTVSLVDAALLIVTLYKTKRGFIRQSTNGSRTECLPLSEDNLRVIVGLTPVSYTHLDVYKRQMLHAE